MSEVAKRIRYEDLNPAQQAWIQYSAVQGVITEMDGSMVKMSITEFARQVGYSRKTLYGWIRTIPNFEALVDEQRSKIAPTARVSKMWNAVYLAGTQKMDMTAARLFLSNFDKNYREPTQKVEHSANDGLLELMATHRQRLQIDSQKVVDVEPNQS